MTEKIRTVEQQSVVFKKEDKMLKLEKLFQTFNTTEVGLNNTFQNFANTIKVHKTSTGDVLNKLQSRIVTATQGIAELQAQLQSLKLILWNAEINFNASKVSSVDKAFSVIIEIPEYSKYRRNEAVQFGDPFYNHYTQWIQNVFGTI